MHRTPAINRALGLIAAAIVGSAAARPAAAAALDVQTNAGLEEIYGVEILEIAAGEVAYQRHADLDAGREVVHRLPLERVVRIKAKEAATFTHSEWQRTEVGNARTAEDGYLQTLEEVRERRSPAWSRTAALARLIALYLRQERFADAVPYLEELSAAAGGQSARFLPGGDIATSDPHQYDRGVRAVHTALLKAAQAGKTLPAVAAFAERLTFRGAEVLRGKGFLGIEDPAVRVVWVLGREAPADDPTVRAAVASAIRRSPAGREFAVLFDAERAPTAERRVGMAAIPVPAGPGAAERLTSVTADPRVIWDELARPGPMAAVAVGDMTGLPAGIRRAFSLVGARRAEDRAEAVFAVVAGKPADRAAIERELERANPPAANGTRAVRFHVIRIPHSEDGAAVRDDADAWWDAVCRRHGGRYRRIGGEEWSAVSTCR